MKNKSLLIIVLTLLLLTSCSSQKKISTTQTPQQKLEIQYQQFKGVKYKYGGTDRRGFDCSGFVQIIFKKAFQIQLPRTAREQSKTGNKISKNKLKPGDLIFFRPSKKYRHVGIYIGNNEFIHSSTSKGVIKSQLDNVYWKKKYRFARRLLR